MTVLQKISMQLHRVFSSDRKSKNPVKRSLIFSYVNIFLLPSSISLMIVAFLLNFLSLTFHLKPKAKISACTDFSDSVFQNLYPKICPFQGQNIKGIFLEWFLCSWIFDFCTKDVEKNTRIKHFLFKIGKIYTCADSIVGDPWIYIYLHHWWTGGRTFKTCKSFHSADNELISCKYCFASAGFRGHRATYIYVAHL